MTGERLNSFCTAKWICQGPQEADSVVAVVDLAIAVVADLATEDEAAEVVAVR